MLFVNPAKALAAGFYYDFQTKSIISSQLTQTQGKGMGWREEFWVGADQHQEEVTTSGVASQHQLGGWGSNWARAATLGGS